MAEIKAIETIYNGYRFRSRLEARWAVFFDALGIKYEYEKEGYDLGELGWYLPDYFLPEFDLWVEIKPLKDSPYNDEFNDEWHKARGLMYATNKPILMCFGAPKDGECILLCLDTCDSGGGEYENNAMFISIDDTWKILLVDEYKEDRMLHTADCGSLSPNIMTKPFMREKVGETANTIIYLEEMNLTDAIELTHLGYPTLTQRAAIKARQARFEHGEKG